MWKRTNENKVSTNGTMLQLCVDIDRDQATKLFGEPEDAWEPEKGYNDNFRFVREDGAVATLYDRWTAWRIGARDPETAASLAFFLRKKNVLKGEAFGMSPDQYVSWLKAHLAVEEIIHGES
jgi:hypothetical protein